MTDKVFLTHCTSINLFFINFATYYSSSVKVPTTQIRRSFKHWHLLLPISSETLQNIGRVHFGLSNTLVRLSMKSKQDLLDSSINKTGVPTLGVTGLQKRSLTLLSVKNTLMVGRVGFIPASCNLFLNFWIEPVHLLNSARFFLMK
jgi:hypothetical protein